MGRLRAVLRRGGSLVCALVVPERPAAEQQEQREDRELGGADALLAAVAVVPGEDQDDRQADQERERRESAEPARGQLNVSLTYSSPCRNPHAAATYDSPLDDLAAAQADQMLSMSPSGAGWFISAPSRRT